MAAPPRPHTPTTAAPFPASPASPGPSTLEQRRVALLLDINLALIAEVSRLQALGHGGAISPQQQQQLKQAGQPDALAGDDYIHCLRRVQANLAYLMPAAQGEQSAQRKPPGPAHMTPPPHMPQLQARYDQLRSLFPGWAGYDQRTAAHMATGGSPGNMNGMGTPA